MSITSSNFEDLAKSIIDGDPDLVKSVIKNLLKSKIDPLKIFENGLTKGIKVVGEKYGCGDLFLTDLLMSADAMKVGMDIISPEIIKQKKIKKLKRVTHP